MTRALVTEESLSNIGNAIRNKLGVQTTYKPSEMAGAISSIPSDLGTKAITANGTYDADDDSLDGYSSVTVNVANSYTAQDEGKVVSSGALVTQTARENEITSNGTYDTTTNDEVTVNVSGGGGGGGASWQAVDAFADPLVLTNPVNVTVSSSEVDDSVLSAVLDVTGGSPYEGFNIPITGLEQGEYYRLSFDSVITGSFIGTSYGYGFSVVSSPLNSYSGNYYNNMVRDNNVNNSKTLFEATASAMYIAFNISGVADGAHTLSISNMKVEKPTEGGGGGSTNILHGTGEPSASDGSNGSIYLKHNEVAEVSTNLLEDYQDLDLWTKNSAAFTRHVVTYDGTESVLDHTGGGGYERIYVPLTVPTGTDMVFSVLYRAESNVPSGYSGQINISVYSSNQSGSDGSTSGRLGYVNLGLTASADFSSYEVTFNTATYTTLYAVIDLNIYDGNNVKLHFKDINFSDIRDGKIKSVYAKVDGSWKDIFSVSITDIDLGGDTPAETVKGFEVYEADFVGNTNNSVNGTYDNKYVVAYFHDNMTNSYQLNGETYTYSTSASGRGGGVIYAVTKEVTNQSIDGGVYIGGDGSTFISHHGDVGSYESFVGGWVGYPRGGTIYEGANSNTETITIAMNSAHETLLVVVAATATGLSSATSVDINGTSHDIVNIGKMYDNMYAVYAAIVIENNEDSTIVVTFPAAVYGYMSIIGLD